MHFPRELDNLWVGLIDNAPIWHGRTSFGLISKFCILFLTITWEHLCQEYRIYPYITEIENYWGFRGMFPPTLSHFSWNQIPQLLPLASLYIGLRDVSLRWAGKSTSKKNKVPSSAFSCFPRCPCKPPLHRGPVQFDIDANKSLCCLPLQIMRHAQTWWNSSHGNNQRKPGDP